VEFRIVEEAMADWQGMVGCQMDYTVSRGATPRDLGAGRKKDPFFVQAWPVSLDDAGAVYGDSVTEGEAGLNPGWSSFVTWKVPGNDRERSRLPVVIRHEIGHALGLDHLPAPSVMQEEGVAVGSVTGEDAEAYDRIWCRPDTMSK